MKLYEHYGKSGFHTCIVTTFGVDFDAYEHVILSRAPERVNDNETPGLAI